MIHKLAWVKIIFFLLINLTIEVCCVNTQEIYSIKGIESAFNHVRSDESEIEAFIAQEVNELNSLLKHQVMLDDHAQKVIFPLGPEVKTSTLNHLRIYNNREYIDQTVFKTMLDTFGKYYPDLIIPQDEYQHYIDSVITPIISREIQYNDSHYVFYHAHCVKNIPQDNILLFQDVLKKLNEWGCLNFNFPIPLRSSNFDTKISENMEEFLDETHSWNIDFSRKFHCNYCKNESDEWFDALKCIACRLVSVNLSLFGFFQSNTCMGCSFWYFISKIGALESGYVEKELRNIFNVYKINQKYLDTIFDISRKYSVQQDAGCMLQIFIRKDVVDELAYFAIPGGKPLNKSLIVDIWNESKKRHTLISPFLKMYQEESLALDGLLKTYEYQEVGNSFFCNLTLCQARLYALSTKLLDPSITKTYRYFTPGYLTKSQIDQYNQEMDAVFCDIIKDLMRQQLEVNVTKNHYSGTLLECLGEWMARKVIQLMKR